MKKPIIIITLSLGMLAFTPAMANQPLVSNIDITALSVPSGTSKQLKMEALLTAKKWICLEVSKKRLTKKMDFDIGNEFSFSIDKKYSFKNNKYDYSNGTWKLDGKYVYFFYNAPGTENKVETAKYKIIKLDENTLILKRTESPKGKITFK